MEATQLFREATESGWEEGKNDFLIGFNQSSLEAPIKAKHRLNHVWESQIELFDLGGKCIFQKRTYYQNRSLKLI